MWVRANYLSPLSIHSLGSIITYVTGKFKELHKMKSAKAQSTATLARGVCILKVNKNIAKISISEYRTNKRDCKDFYKEPDCLRIRTHYHVNSRHNQSCFQASLFQSSLSLFSPSYFDGFSQTMQTSITHSLIIYSG